MIEADWSSLTPSDDDRTVLWMARMSSLKVRLGFVFTLLISVGVGFTGYLAYSRSAAALEDQLGARLVSIAKTGALMIDGDLHSTLMNPEDEGSAGYNEIKRILQAIQAETDAAYVYTFAPKDDQSVVFVVDAAEGEDMSHLGDEYELEPEMVTAFEGTPCFTEDLYTDAWGTFKSGYAPLLDSSGQVVAILGIDLSAADVLAETRSLLVACIAAGVAAVALGAVASVLFSSSVVAPIERLVKASESVASGDLTIDIQLARRKDEIGRLQTAYAGMVTRLKDTIQELGESASEVASTSSQLSASAADSMKSSEQIATVVQMIAQSAREQSVQATNSASAVDRLAPAISQVATGAETQIASVSATAEKVNGTESVFGSTLTMLHRVGKSANESSASAFLGAKSVDDIVANMRRIGDAASGVSGTIAELTGLSQEIGRIVDVIDEIASQTNLLSLNAAIEAARAGEAGRGFAVVADEVRGLAERSSQETKTIARLINRIGATIEKAVTATEQEETQVEQGRSLAEQAGKVLRSIAGSAQETASLVGELVKSAGLLKGAIGAVSSAMNGIAEVSAANSESARTMAESSDQVRQLIEIVAAASEESSASSEQAATATLEVRKSVQQVSDVARELAAIATALERRVAMFRI